MTDFRNAAPRGNDAIGTKPKLWRPLARAVGGFDLDPAAGAEPTQIADDRYTKADDGLAEEWYGTVWLNPPFSEKAQWYRKLINEYQRGSVDRAVVVAPVDTSTEWFQRWFSRADVICFLSGRAWYLRDSQGHASFSSMIGVWNPTDDVVAVLDGLGVVVAVQGGDEQATLPIEQPE